MAKNKHVVGGIESSASKVKHIYKRGAVYYWRQVIHGTAYHESLETGNLEVARRRMKIKQSAAQEEKWDALLSTRLKRGYSTFADLYAAYRASLARRVRPSAQTAEDYILAMNKILIRCGHSKPLEVSLGVLTPDLLDAYFAAEGPDPALPEEERNSRLRTIRSCVTSARAILSRQSVQYYRSLTLPDLSEFLTYRICDNPKIQYRLPVDQPYEEIIRSAREELPATRPELYQVFLLVYDLGMRAGEAANARWTWIEKHGKSEYMNIIRRPDEYKPKGREGKIRIPACVAADLRRYGSSTPYILPGTAWGRDDLIKRKFAKWMRGMGWTRRECAHELRKLKGSFWQQRYGLDQAYNWLRHKQYQTTLDYYADMPLMPEPYPVDTDMDELVIRRVG